ncbi:hypothetical protein [Cellvibrio polysaccharolyticus]|uniref:Uncharacterized protein n=1 Tax=Cellvibrio polysaccharolyticus TaxID=2082724 RepID=A0A928V6Q4_9GAMM|nr:hypothetical protein [Cellvibrio polysaccharolyticus]MBE8718175.1 hypothetical protein [Cellvibrio polysaccharolyticus]
MIDTQTTPTSNSASLLKSKNPTTEKLLSTTTLPSLTIGQDIHISAEAQYLFEMDKYLMGLGRAELDSALNYLMRSEDPLQKKAVDYFITNKEARTLNGPVAFSGATRPEESERRLLDTGLVINEFNEIALRPSGVSVFRLDGKTGFVPVQFGGYNQALKDEIDALEKSMVDVIGNQDRANLFGSVKNALIYSENIMLSFDDVLHFNYATEKARKAINFLNAPEEIKSRLSEILDKGVQYQNQKQTAALNDSKKFLGNSQVGSIANENIRLGVAAQRYNSQLQNALVNSNLSILDSRELLNQLLMNNSDLIRFTPEKLDESIVYYKNDYENFERALNKEISTPSTLKTPELDRGILEEGSNYAMKVIQSIQNYASK